MRVESRRFNNLVFGRLVTVIAIQIFLMSYNDVESVNYVTMLTALALVSLPLLFKAARNRFKSVPLNILFVVFDSLYVFILINLTGGINSPFTLLLPLYIFITSYTLRNTGILISAVLSEIIIVATFFISGNPAEIKTLVLLTMSFFVFAAIIYFFRNQYEETQKDIRSISKLNDNLINNLKIGMVILNRNNNILSINNNAKNIARNKFDIKSRLEDLKEAGSIEPHKYQVDGNTYLNVHYIETSKYSFMILRDISQDVIQEINEEEYNKLKLIGSITAILAHEIKNPVASLVGAGELIEKDPVVFTTGEQGKKLLGIIARETSRLNNLVEEFLMFSSPDRRSDEIINMPQLLTTCCECIQSHTGYIEKKLSVEFINDGNRHICYGDYHRISQCFDNLLINSVHASRDNGKITCAIKGKKDICSVTVSDEGTGVPENVRPKIFEPFFTTKKQGTGLGLAIVNNIIKAHGGKIELENSRLGAAFTVTLPQENTYEQ
ncbi:MAG: HAMP domain-containing histidine kinase [Oligoflexia bacterium]|nr:HAMP domain-containing histidine kinase [Oligoflexia bacterium]